MEKRDFDALTLSYIKSLLEELSLIRAILNDPSYRVFGTEERFRNVKEYCEKLEDLPATAQRMGLLLNKEVPFARGLSETAEGMKRLTSEIADALDDMSKGRSRYPEKEYELYLKGIALEALFSHVKSMLTSCASMGMETRKLSAELQLMQKSKPSAGKTQRGFSFS